MRGAAARSDLALRLRIAELRQKDGAWRTVFATLRRAKVDSPDHVAEIDRRLKDAHLPWSRTDPLAGEDGADSRVDCTVGRKL